MRYLYFKEDRLHMVTKTEDPSYVGEYGDPIEVEDDYDHTAFLEIDEDGVEIFVDKTKTEILIETTPTTDRRESIRTTQAIEGGSNYTVEELDAYLDEQLDPTRFDELGLVIYQLSDDDISPIAKSALIDMFQEIKAVFGKVKSVQRKIAVEILK